MCYLLLALLPAIVPVRVSATPPLDRLDRGGWLEARPSSDFVQKFPDGGAPPTEPTSVRVVYDDHAIYVGVSCQQSLAPIVGRLTRRDRSVEADRVEIDLATRGDGKSAFHFGVNAAGVLVDGLRYDDTELSLDWDENWEAYTHRTSDGWEAIFVIPLRILRFRRAPAQDWGFQVRRYLSGRQEIDEWAYIPRDAGGEVSRYGTVGPLSDLDSRGAVELRPFALARMRRRDATPDSLASGVDATGSLGVDAHWHVTPSLTLDASVLPDFAQVEGDQVVLNLTTFETFFPEKRPFFLEGFDAFATPVQVLYTRRIGRQPLAPVLRSEPPFGEQLVDLPDPSPIWGATKLVGRAGSDLTVGGLVALTGENDVDVQSSGPPVATQRRVADPTSLYSALRLKLDLGPRAHLGLIGTGVARFESADAAPSVGAQALCPDGTLVDGGARCFHDAWVAGLDARWRSRDGDYVLVAQALASAITGGPPRALPDGTAIADGDVAPGALLALAKQGGSLLFELDYQGFGRRFDANDAGYLERANMHDLSENLELRDVRPGHFLNEVRARVELFQRFNLDGLDLARGWQLNTSGKLRNFWQYFVEIHYREAHFDDREVGDGTALERDGLIGLEVNLSTDPRAALVVGFRSQSQRLFDGWNFNLGATLTLRTLPQLELELEPTFRWTTGESRFVAPGSAPGSYLFGRQDALATGLTLRATYTFTPRLTLQTYAQIFLAAVHYDDFTVATPRDDHTVHLDDLTPASPPTANPDLEDAVLNVNLVLRWEYRLGSTLFLVYTRSQQPATPLAMGQTAALDFGAALHGPASDAFLVKLSYWWG
jgi:uncharacterized protein DUF5916